VDAVARVSKTPDVRRDELLDIALHLCATIGYDNMSIDQVTRAASVAKGTFYYHFSSKQDMLIALVDRFVNDLFANLDAAASTVEGTGAERFHRLLLSATAWKTERLDDALAFVPLLYKPENLELRHRLFDSWTARTRHIFLPLVDRGATDGSFDVTDAEATTDLVLAIWLDGSSRMYDRALATDTEDAFVDTVTRGIAALSAGVERVLGAAPGTFTVPYDHAVVRAMRVPFLAALNGTAVPTRSNP
jgi:AcrR family transcriptional regulator